MVTTLTAEDFHLDEEVEEVDVLDLPQLYNRPSYNVLIDTLTELRTAPASLGSTPNSGTPRSTSGASTPFKRQRKFKSEGVPGYLTKIIASRLAWIDDDAEKEEVWEVASQALSERSGRMAMGDLTRIFHVPLRSHADAEVVELVLHEPAITGDSLGHKTWASSALLAARLASLAEDLPARNVPVLELGAGTGLVGMAAACVLGTHVVMTDLPDIVDNLRRNAAKNMHIINQPGGSTSTGTLDWRHPDMLIVEDGTIYQPQSFELILAADVLYSAEHPQLLANAIKYHLSRSKDARVVFELPQRDGFDAILLAQQPAMESIGLTIIHQGIESGYDDWSGGTDQEQLEVHCYWTIWAWRDSSFT